MKAASCAQAALLQSAAAAAHAAVVKPLMEDRGWLLAEAVELHAVGPLKWGYAELPSRQRSLKPVRPLPRGKVKSAAQNAWDVDQAVPAQRAARTDAAAGWGD